MGEGTEGATPPKETPPGLDIQIGVENGNVVCLFSQLLSSLSLPPDQAEKMGLAMLHHAREARKLVGS